MLKPSGTVCMMSSAFPSLGLPALLALLTVDSWQWRDWGWCVPVACPTITAAWSRRPCACYPTATACILAAATVTCRWGGRCRTVSVTLPVLMGRATSELPPWACQSLGGWLEAPRPALPQSSECVRRYMCTSSGTLFTLLAWNIASALTNQRAGSAMKNSGRLTAAMLEGPGCSPLSESKSIRLSIVSSVVGDHQFVADLTKTQLIFLQVFIHRNRVHRMNTTRKEIA